MMLCVINGKASTSNKVVDWQAPFIYFCNLYLPVMDRFLKTDAMGVGSVVCAYHNNSYHLHLKTTVVTFMMGES